MFGDLVLSQAGSPTFFGARVQDWPRAQEWAHIFLGGSAPHTPLQVGMEVCPRLQDIFHQSQQEYQVQESHSSTTSRILHTYPDSVTKSRPLVCGIRSVSSRQYDVNITFCSIYTTFALPSTNHRKKVDNRPIFRLSIYIIYISLLAPYWLPVVFWVSV